MSAHSPVAPFAAADSVAADTVYRRIAWRIVPFLMLCYLCAYLDRVNVGFAKLQMMSELGLSDAAYGLGAGIFFLGYCLFEVPSNIMLHRFGARMWIARIMVSWGMLSAMFSLIQTPWQFYVLRFCLGVAEAGLAPGVLLYLTYWFPSHRRAKVTVLWFTAIPLSGIVGGPLSGWLIERMDGVSGWAGWRWMFLVEAIPTMLVGLLVIAVLANGVRDVRWLSDGEKAMVTRELDADEQHKTHHASPLGFLRDRRVWLLGTIYFCIVVAQYAVTFWLPTMIRTAGVTRPLEIGVLSALPYLAAIVAMILIGRSEDRRRERRFHLAAPMAAGALGLLLTPLMVGTVSLSLLALCLAASGILAASSVFWMLPTNILGGVSAAAGIAAINSFANLGGFFSPNLVGWVTAVTGSNAGGLYVIAGLLFGAALLVFRVPARMVNR